MRAGTRPSHQQSSQSQLSDTVRADSTTRASFSPPRLRDPLIELWPRMCVQDMQMANGLRASQPHLFPAPSTGVSLPAANERVEESARPATSRTEKGFPSRRICQSRDTRSPQPPNCGCESYFVGAKLQFPMIPLAPAQTRLRIVGQRLLPPEEPVEHGFRVVCRPSSIAWCRVKGKVVFVMLNPKAASRRGWSSPGHLHAGHATAS